MAMGDTGAFFEGNLESPSSSTGVGASFGMGLFSSALSAFNAYDSAKHSAAMAKINWQHNRNMVMENLKVNSYITARNKRELLGASKDKELAIEVQAMQAKASARVIHAAEGIEGGSAQAVIHDITRQAENAENARLVELDEALFGNKLQEFQAATGAQSAIGLQPISSVSPGLFVGAFAADAVSQTGTLLDKG